MVRTNYQLTGDFGESLVVEELRRRGFDARLMPNKNEKVNDVVTVNKKGEKILIQVKATTTPPKKDGHNVWRFDKARKKLLGLLSEKLEKLFYIFVSTGSDDPNKKFYIARAIDMKDETEKYSLKKNHRKTLEQFDSNRFEKRGYKFISWEEMLAG